MTSKLARQTDDYRPVDWSIPSYPPSNSPNSSSPIPNSTNNSQPLQVLKHIRRQQSIEGKQTSLSHTGYSRSSLTHQAPSSHVSKKLKKLLDTFEVCQTKNVDRQADSDWLSLHGAFEDAIYLLESSPESLNKHLNLIVPVASAHIGCLRSTLAKAAINLTERLLKTYGTSPEVEAELQNITMQLIKRASATGSRETFLIQAADSGLAAALQNTHPAKLLPCLLSVLSNITSAPSSRSKLARCLHQVLVQSKSSNLHTALTDSACIKCLKAAAAFVTDGASSTRKYGRAILWAVRRSVEETKGPKAFQKLVRSCGDQAANIIDSVWLQPPPPPE